MDIEQNYLPDLNLFFRQDPLEDCSVKNCEFIGDDDKLESADAVIVHLHRGDIPPSDHRNPNQRWIFLNDEAPGNAFSLSRHKIALSSLHNVFNWSMTYRYEHTGDVGNNTDNLQCVTKICHNTKGIVCTHCNEQFLP